MIDIFGTVPPNATAKWVPEPNNRGSFGLLSSCLITMALCTWTAVHLNIPQHGETGLISPQLLRKAKWLIVSLLAPELIVWVAWEQHMQACYLHSGIYYSFQEYQPRPWLGETWRSKTSMIRRLFSQDPIRVPGRHDWTMTHSYYAVMGGFGVDATGLSLFNPHRYTHFTLSADGVIWLMRNAQDVLPDLPAADIWDRSKASGVAKLLVFLQAIWFCAQCVGRIAQNLNISLLELNTFAHALCALVVYIFWWNKPLDVESRTELQGTFRKEVTALIVFLCNRNERMFSNHVQHDVPYIRHLRIHRQSSSVDTGPFDAIEVVKSRSNPYDDYPAAASVELSTEEWGTIQAATDELLRRFDMRWADVALAGDPDPKFFRHQRELLVLRAINWPMPYGFGYGAPRPTYVSWILAGLLYGGLHLTAWNAPFSTQAQQVLWRVSAILLTSSGFIYAFLVEVGDFLDWDECCGTSFGYKALKVLAALFYILCRVYLVVECFISLARLPESVYEVPQWSQYFPHIG